MRFLVDECLSLELVSVVAEAGYEAHHVAHVGKAGWKDWNVLRHACENDFVLVTNNAADFRKLYADESLHAGLVILIPNVPADIARTVRRVPEVLVKVSGGARTLAGVQRHMKYIEKKGELGLETDMGMRASGEHFASRLVADWDLDIEALKRYSNTLGERLIFLT